jgi:hypothetical protein
MLEVCTSVALNNLIQSEKILGRQLLSLQSLNNIEEILPVYLPRIQYLLENFVKIDLITLAHATLPSDVEQFFLNIRNILENTIFQE